MTKNEAIEVLRHLQDSDYPKYSEACEMAIKSLEAWNAIREIFKAKATSEDWEYIHDLQIWEDALEIIDKHLSELEV